MKRFGNAAHIDPAVATYWRRVFTRNGVTSKDPDVCAALTAKGIDAATAKADEVMRLARDRTFH